MADDDVDADDGPQVLVLFTSVTSDKIIRVNQERLEQLFYVKGVPIKLVDASDLENKALREALFAVSGFKGLYPQVFIEQVNGSFTFSGDYKGIHANNEHNSETGAFDKTFMCVPAYAEALGPERAAYLESLPALPDPRRSVWEKCTSKGGEPYFFCRASGESSWVDPQHGLGPGGAWLSQTDAKGRTYYYNRRTGKTAWTLPSA